MQLSELKINPNNPRQISQYEKAKLKDSINGFEKMMKANPIVIDENSIILSGNQRYNALLELDYKQIPDEWVRKVTDFTEKEKKGYGMELDEKYCQVGVDRMLTLDPEITLLRNGKDVTDKYRAKLKDNG